MGKPKQVSKEDLIQAVKQQLLQHGSHRVTLKNVAERIGVTQGVVYYHFKTKDQLLTSLYENYLENEVEEEFQSYNQLHVSERLELYLKEKGYQARIQSEEQHLLYELAVLSLHHRDIKKVMDKIMRSRVEEMSKFLCSEEVNGRIFRAVLDGLIFQTLFDPAFDIESTLDHVYELFLNEKHE